MTKKTGLTAEEVATHSNACCDAMFAAGRAYVRQHDVGGLDLVIVVFASRTLHSQCEELLQNRINDVRAQQN